MGQVALDVTAVVAVTRADAAFVLSFTEALAVEVRGTGVTVTVVAPGTVDSGFFAAAGASSEGTTDEP